MIKEELSKAERKRISKLGGQGRAKAMTQAQRTAQAQAAARARYEKADKTDKARVAASAA